MFFLGYCFFEIPSNLILEVPCLTAKYWSTFQDVSGADLARPLRRVRAHRPARPLPRITGLSDAERSALERDLVERSILYARDHLGL